MKKITDLLEKDFTTEKIKQLSKDLRDISDEIFQARSIAIDNFSSIKSLTISYEKDPEIGNLGWLSINLVVDSDVDLFLDEYNNYSKIFAQTIPLEKMDFIHLNYSFACVNFNIDEIVKEQMVEKKFLQIWYIDSKKLILKTTKKPHINK